MAVYGPGHFSWWEAFLAASIVWRLQSEMELCNASSLPLPILRSLSFYYLIETSTLPVRTWSFPRPKGHVERQLEIITFLF